MKYRIFTAVTLCWILGFNNTICLLINIRKAKYNDTQNILFPIEKKILGGLPVSLHRYPFNVQFINFDALCGGSILTKKAVLTAAHCFDYNRDKEKMIIVANARFVLDHSGTKYEVWDFKIHESYTRRDKESLANDVAIILILEDFVFNEHVQKANLSNTFAWMKENETLYATGWGETEHGKSVAGNALNAAPLQFMDLHKCMEWNKLKLSADLFCLYGDGERDTCRGDSGGPILWRGLLVGITSHGRPCGTAPGMYANVGYFMHWIKHAVTTLTEKFCLIQDVGR